MYQKLISNYFLFHIYFFMKYARIILNKSNYITHYSTSRFSLQCTGRIENRYIIHSRFISLDDIDKIRLQVS